MLRPNAARFDVSKLGPVLEDIFERLSGVVIENLDWSDILDRYDRADALFYLDPPYWGCEDDYGKEIFSRDDFHRIAEKLRSMKGRAIVSLNDTPGGVRETFDGLNMETFDIQYMIGQASGGPKDVKEVLIYNFDLPDEGLLGLI